MPSFKEQRRLIGTTLGIRIDSPAAQYASQLVKVQFAGLDEENMLTSLIEMNPVASSSNASSTDWTRKMLIYAKAHWSSALLFVWLSAKANARDGFKSSATSDTVSDKAGEGDLRWSMALGLRVSPYFSWK